MYSRLVTTSYCYSSLPSKLTTSAMPKVEAINVPNKFYLKNTTVKDTIQTVNETN